MISVLICTYNRCDSLRQTLASLAEMTVPPALEWELIVVDNNSADQTRTVVEEFAASSKLRVRYVFEGNQGLSYARNTGIQQARGEVVAFTDDDVVLDGHWLAAIAEAFEQHDCDSVAGKIIAVWPCEKPSWFQESGPYATSRGIIAFDLGAAPCECTAAPPGANWAFRKQVFEKCGWFRGDLGRKGTALFGGEDIEFYLRATATHKLKIMYTPAAVVYHPVTEERTRKPYFLAWSYNGGRSQIRLQGVPAWAVCYFGMPRYYLRSLATCFLRWVTSLNATRRFYYKQQTYMYAGFLREARALHQPGTLAVRGKSHAQPAR